VDEIATDMENHKVAVAYDDTKTSAQALGEALTRGDYPSEGAPRPLAAMPSDPGKMLVGKTTQGALFRDYPVFMNNYRSYTPRKDAVDKLAALRDPHDILVFFGTWCQDSVSEIPKILRILDAADNRNLKPVLYGVGRDNKEGIGMSERFGIQRVPTTIVLRDGVELGRIVEYPQTSNEEDLLRILQKK
jgi:thiol-disulfide isomerase/thioredoxin